MNDCILMVDNGFFKLVKKHLEDKANKKFMLLESLKNICKNEKLNLKHLFFYWAPPFQSSIPTDDEKARKRRYDLLKKMLDKKNWITYREGRCQKNFDENRKAVFTQKGVDSWIVADMCLFNEDFPNIKKIILISSDSDFAPIIGLIRERKKIEVILFTYFDNIRRGIFHRSNYLINSVSKWRRLEESHFVKKEIKENN